jgi:uncharacterized protein YecE (DUF72 family)
MAAFHLGLAVWGFDRWVGGFFPDRTRKADMLRRYAERLDCVEGNDSFYGVPSASTLERRVRETPPSFRFCPKLPRAISHEGPLVHQVAAATRFGHHLRDGLGERLGPFFLQLPPSYGPSEGPDLARLLNAWRREVGLPLLVEVRHEDWYRAEFGPRLDTLLARLGLGRVVLDTRPIYSGGDDPQSDNPRKKPELPLHAAPVSGVSLVRFISHPDPLRNEPFLHEWAERVHQWLDAGVEVYFFVHCPDDFYSPATARRFHRLLTARGAPVGPLLWDTVPAEPVQAGLFGGAS